MGVKRILVRSFGCVLALAAALAAGPVSGAAPFGPARVDSGGAVVWAEAPGAAPAALLDFARALAGATRADSIRVWRALAGAPDIGPFALRQLAPLLLAEADTLAADSAWTSLARAPGVWTYEALRGRADLMLARGDTSAADSVLAVALREEWPDLERVSWLVRRAELRAARSDTAQALELARQAVRRFPALKPAGRALDDLELWLPARAEPFTAGEELSAAEAEFYRPDHAAAARRLERAALALTGSERARADLRRAEILRLDRRFADAEAALADAEVAAPDSGERAAVALARARVHRDAGRPDSAFAHYRRAAALGAEPATRETAWWELAREAEDRERWDVAREGFDQVVRLDGRRAADAAVRDGLIRWAASDTAGALDRWRGRSTEAARFWRAVAARGADRSASDLALDSLARLPGYGFYRMAARETLEVRGWPGTLAHASDTPVQAVRLAAALLALGARDEAVRVLDRWGAGDARVEGKGESTRLDPGQLLAAARVAFGALAYGAGIRWARAAFDSLAAKDPAAAWAVAPWSYPPAFDTLYARYPDPEPAARSGAPAGLLPAGRPDRLLLYAVTWQESKFDPLARSRSDALGLMQLKLATAADEAHRLGLPAPREADLFDPGKNLRLGAGYLGRLLRRFDGRPVVALAAYNAGPTAARRWARVPDPGGEALACERVGYGQAYDYVRTILGVRQAVREIGPRRE